ncbi:MAG: glycosyltransferase family 2 protein [Bacteroidetes bacterium]|nr:glycosyltransferase family 2 protein [Bacteroidota bacterium]
MTSRQSPLVSIITVNFNGSEDTLEMIESLTKITYPNFEIIVVDNHSENDTPRIIKERFPSVTLYESNINMGFAGGNNLGIMRARGEYILLLNNDTIVDKGFLEPLVKKMQSDPKIGCVSSKLRFYYDRSIIQFAGYTPIDHRTMRSFAIGYREKDKGQHDVDRVTPYAHGAAMMVSMKVIREIGIMSYIFFLYYEEADWSYRIKKAGYTIWYVHDSLVYHKESVSVGKLSASKVYYQNRNRIVFLRRNVTGKDFRIGILYQLAVAIPKNAFKYLLKGKLTYFHAYLRAIGWHLKNIVNPHIHDNPYL